ncbi:hypothetical protein IWZ01DRAFT_4414 [Phyllosticta capitalensis]
MLQLFKLVVLGSGWSVQQADRERCVVGGTPASVPYRAVDAPLAEVLTVNGQPRTVYKSAACCGGVLESQYSYRSARQLGAGVGVLHLHHDLPVCWRLTSKARSWTRLSIFAEFWRPDF